MRRHRRLVALSVTPVLAAGLFTIAGVKADSQAAVGGGCDPPRPAIAFHSDGSSAPATGAPLTCASNTGFGGQETHIRVAPDGEVVEIPAQVPTGLPSYMEAGIAM